MSKLVDAKPNAGYFLHELNKSLHPRFGKPHISVQ
ncbi:hypothetical protein TRIP_C20036 [Candidatus Zixiibacteriota bacterium]|nr:hypothetical protein TRIP_C20036 [candidate division Zixibacteria bacterium]